MSFTHQKSKSEGQGERADKSQHKRRQNRTVASSLLESMQQMSNVENGEQKCEESDDTGSL